MENKEQMDLQLLKMFREISDVSDYQQKIVKTNGGAKNKPMEKIVYIFITY
jgi:hypothetical protein